MNTTSTIGIQIDAAIHQIADLIEKHVSRLSAIRLFTFELKLPEDVEDDENLIFLSFAGSFRYFLAHYGLLPFCLWLRDQVGNRCRYRCIWFLSDFSSALVDEFFMAAECVWKKSLGSHKDNGEIRWLQGHSQGQLLANGAKIREGRSDGQRVTAIYQSWLIEMQLRAHRVQDQRNALRTFGAVHRY